LPVDWSIFQAALQQSREGDNLKAINEFSALLFDTESNSERAAILLGQSSCYSQLGNIVKSREVLALAKQYAQGDRLALSQVEMTEGSLCAQNDEYDLACEKFISVKSEYSDLLALPENEDFVVELNSRLACTLVDAGRYNESIQLFRELFSRKEVHDKQRLQLYFGIALLNLGNTSEAQRLLFDAMKGSDPGLAKSASDFLTKAGRASLKV